MKDTLDERMKGYENITRTYLTKRMPTIIRLDGKAFHTFTKGFKKPFDMIMVESMWDAAKYLCENIQGCKVAYIQSDEITLLLTDYKELNTVAWFDKNVQKMVGVSASYVTLSFNKAFWDRINERLHLNVINESEYNKYHKKIFTSAFDSRVFSLPKEEVCNCFIWRQKDAIRNSIEATGRAYFTNKELYKLNREQIINKLIRDKSIDWNTLPTYLKHGACIRKEKYTLDNEQHTIRSRWVIDNDIPIFTENREYIEKYL